MSLFSPSKTSLSHQRELCIQLRLGLWWGPAVMSSEWSVTSQSHTRVGIPGAWPLLVLWG